MTALDFVIAATALLGGVLGVFNYFDKRKNTHMASHVNDAATFKTENEGYLLANQRAELAEKRADAVEERLNTLEKSLSYRLTFDVTLGMDPAVQHVIIEHFPERRIKDTAHGAEQRKTSK